MGIWRLNSRVKGHCGGWEAPLGLRAPRKPRDTGGVEGHFKQLWEVGGTMGARRHCGRLGYLQLAGGLRRWRPWVVVENHWFKKH